MTTQPGYPSPIPPLAEPVRRPRVGTYDRFGSPQDTIEGRVVGHPRPATAPRHAPVSFGRRRSVLLAVGLAALLGPIGLLYASRVGALLVSTFFMMLALPVIPFWPEWVFVAAVPVWMLSVLWAGVATIGRNAAVAMRQRMAPFATRSW